MKAALALHTKQGMLLQTAPLCIVAHGVVNPHTLGGNVSAPGIFCDPCPTGGLLPLICWATLYGFAPWPPGHQQMF